MLANSLKDRRIFVAELLFNDHTYAINQVHFSESAPVGLSKDDRVIELLMDGDVFSRDLVNYMATNGSTYPMLTVNIKDGQKMHKIVNASPVNWNGAHVTIVGGRDYDLEARAIKLVEIRDAELAIQLAARRVREMKMRDPVLARFEIELED